MNGAQRPNRPRRLSKVDILMIVLAVMGVRIASDYLVDQLLAHFLH